MKIEVMSKYISPLLFRQVFMLEGGYEQRVSPVVDADDWFLLEKLFEI